MLQLVQPMTHRVQPGTRGSPGASKAARLSTPEWVPGKNLGLYLPSETAPAPDEALVDKKRSAVERREKLEQLNPRGKVRKAAL